MTTRAAAELSPQATHPPKRKRKPPSKRRGPKNTLGDGRSSGPGRTNESQAAFIRRVTRNGEFLAETMYSIAKGIPRSLVMVLPPPENSNEVRVLYYTAPAPLQDQMKAIDWLELRGWGKPVEHTEITGKQPFNLIFLGQRRDPVATGELDRPPKALPPAS